MIGNLLAVPALGVAALAGLALMLIGLSNEAGRDGGRAVAAFLAAAPFALALLLAGGVALARGGFDWIGLPRPATVLLVLVALAAAAGLSALSAALRLEPASQAPWALLPLRGWLHLVWPPLLVAGLALALWPTLGGSAAGPWRHLPAALVGGVTLLVGGLMVVEWAQHSLVRQREQLAAMQQDGHERDRWIREQVQAADVQRDLASLLNQTSRWERADIRALALQKVHSHPDLTAALAALLRSPAADQAFTYLDSNAPPDPAALAGPVREGLLQMAEVLRLRMRDTHTLHPGEFTHEVERMLAVADRFAGHGVDFRPALQEVRRALDEPRDQPSGTPDLRARALLDRWLRKH